MIRRAKRVVPLLLSVIILVGVFSPIFLSRSASAAQITARALTLQAGSTDGGSKPSGVVNHLFSFTLPNVGSVNVGSIQFQYCTLAAGTCTTPIGLSTTGATYGSNSGATFTSLVATTNGAPYLSRVAAPITAGQAVTEQLLGVTNPDGTSCTIANGFASNTSPNCTFYVRISTFASTDATGSPIDTGTVAASTSTQIIVTGTMPESLVFCDGVTVGTTSGVPDCSTAGAGSVNFNQLFSPTDTATATSQMAASTNAGSGYVITVNGTTLTSGSNTVTAMGAPTTGVRGTSQFGINLVANTTATSTPAVGTAVAPASNGTNYRGQPRADYTTANTFKYLSTDPIADSANGGAGGTDAQIFTISYIVNVPGSQPAGTYTTTLTYICTPTF